MGSVKDLVVIRKPKKDTMGVGRFVFSDRYSVFDWGEMPDLIEGKGEALCIMGAYCFEKLEEKKVKTHYRGLVDKNGNVKRFHELSSPSSTMEISLVNVYKPKAVKLQGKLGYDYTKYSSELKNCLIPLEVIYRNGLPEGSSVLKRLEQRQITPEQLGLDHYPKPGERLAKPIFDVSTKLEDKDRYITWEEAKIMVALTPTEVLKIQELLLTVDRLVSELGSRAGLINEDGKIELAFDDERELMVVDVVGTLDECRFSYEGLHVSKEIARQHYRKTEWYEEVETAKRKAEKTGIQNWKRFVKDVPPKLDPKLKKTISQMYKAVANEITRKTMFSVPKLSEIVKEIADHSEQPKN